MYHLIGLTRHQNVVLTHSSSGLAGVWSDPNHDDTLSPGLSKVADTQLEHTRTAILAFQPIFDTSLLLHIVNRVPGVNSEDGHRACSPGFKSPTLTFHG